MKAAFRGHNSYITLCRSFGVHFKPFEPAQKGRFCSVSPVDSRSKLWFWLSISGISYHVSKWFCFCTLICHFHKFKTRTMAICPSSVPLSLVAAEVLCSDDTHWHFLELVKACAEWSKNGWIRGQLGLYTPYQRLRLGFSKTVLCTNIHFDQCLICM